MGFRGSAGNGAGWMLGSASRLVMGYDVTKQVAYRFSGDHVSGSAWTVAKLFHTELNSSPHSDFIFGE